MTNRPTIAVIIATFNRGARIATTLDSVVRQTAVPFEMIVVDDGSTDGTGEWIQRHYPGMRVVRTRNGGTSAARNRGAREASADALIFLDHDDELLPQAIETLLKLLQRFPDARAAFADHTYTNRVNGTYWPNHHFAQAPFRRLRAVPIRDASAGGRLYGRELYHALLRGNLLQQPWAIYRQTFLALGGFADDVRYCEDWDMYLRVTASVEVAMSDAVISNHYVEGQNLHLAPDQEQMHMHVLQRQLARRRRGDFRALVIVRSRLAMYYKSAGDKLRATDLGQAWRCYLRSFVLWPFDHAVALRTLSWLVRLSFARG